MFLKKIGTTPLSPIRRALLPVAAIVLALVCQGALQLVLPKGNDFPNAFLYLIAIFVVAWWGGYLPGVTACLLTMVALPWAVSRHLPAIDASRMILLLGISLGISGVADAQRRIREALRRANDELDLRVQERTKALATVVEALESEVTQHKTTEHRLEAQLERLNLLDQITRAIGERQDLASVYQVVIRRLEDHLPIDFGCVCLYDAAAEMLTVTRIGVRSETLAQQLAMTEQSRIVVGQNGLSRCVQGHLVYEPDVTQVDFPFPQCLARSGLRAVVSAPLQVESHVFGVLIAARREPESFSSGECEFLRQLCEHVALASHQAQVYEALQGAYDDLRQTQQTVMQQERLRALGQMASGIAHDINNALSPVALYTEILLETEPNLSKQTRKYLETTQRSVEDVAHTVGRMREFYRQQEPQLEHSLVDLSQLAQQVLDLTRARWSDMPLQRGIVIHLKHDLPPGLPPVAGVESEIREALTNLVLNAVDAMPEGGTLTLRAEATGARSGSPYVALEVTDTGMGMSETTRRRCLDPFFTTKGERGTGLGLAMVYGIAQRHNAEIEIASELGKGTTMRLLFPVAAPAQSGSNKDADSSLSGARLRILVVDDDPLIIKSLRDALETDGHLVTTANGGQEGVEAFDRSVASGEAFAVVITDLGMPYVDGRKVSAAVKARSPHTPVVLLTGWGQRLTEQGDVPPHVDRVLNKPPKLRELRVALREVVTGTDLAALFRELPSASNLPQLPAACRRVQAGGTPGGRKGEAMNKEIIQNSRIFLVDDQAPNLMLMERILKEAGYRYWTSFMDARKALAAFAAGQPDLIVLDWRMPNMDGLSFLRQVRSRIPAGDFVPTLVLTAENGRSTRQAALAAGAKDFLSKPLDVSETLLRIYNLLETRWLHVELRTHNETLGQKVRERTRDLERAQLELLQRLALAAEYRDDCTGQHAQRVGQLAALLGRAAGLAPDQVELVRRAAPLHDIGKIGIPDGILLKPAKLTVEEYAQIKRHTDIGRIILSGSAFPTLQMAERIALYHHERWDGAGYYGLVGEEIPLEARIVSVADVYDVVTHVRPYKPAQTPSDALALLQEESGKQFDPNLVQIIAALNVPLDLAVLSGALEQEDATASRALPVAQF